MSNDTKGFIDVNVFEIIKKAYDEKFNRRKNKLGASELPFCARKTIISRLYHIPFETNMKMLHGKIHHAVIQDPKVLTELIGSIYKQLAIKKKEVNVKTEKLIIKEIIPGKFIEGHVDIFADDFLIEIKTTSVPLIYSKDIAPYYFVQTNTYLGLTNLTLGFILLVNLLAFQSEVSNFNDMWKKYGCFVPVQFNQELYDKTIEKAILMFKFMDQDKFNIAGPEFEWECRKCTKKIKEICLKKRIQNFS